MSISIREFNISDIEQMVIIWNEIVESGIAFPQIEKLDVTSAEKFFSEQTFTGVAIDENKNDILGLYILHPNNIGRCSHICNASYAVKSTYRGQHIGEMLVKHCILTAKNSGFKILQFNAVVKTNLSALHLYEKLGFVKLGVIPNGFLQKNGEYEDIIPHYIEL